MSQERPSTPTPTSADGSPLVRLGILLAVVVLMGVSIMLLYRSFTQRGTPTDVSVDLPVNSNLNPVEAFALGFYIDNNAEQLNTPRSPDEDFRTFEVVSGSTAADVADALLAEGFISDGELFTNYLRYYGLDRDIEAGVYTLSPSLTIPEIADRLSDSSSAQVTVRIPEGWRREQIADWIDLNPDLAFSGAEFLAASASPSSFGETTLDLAYIPADRSLEGFLFPDTYLLRPDAEASDLVRRMVETFDRRLTPQLRADIVAQGLTVHEVVTLASIVEREAVVEEERPMIAGVYLNRLEIDMLLQADPTVQYAQGYREDTGDWWNLALTQADYRNVDSPYNTYLYTGMPPGPIANPGIASIEAVVYPAESPFIFFRAACDGSGRHNFAVTFEEHQANACQ